MVKKGKKDIKIDEKKENTKRIIGGILVLVGVYLVFALLFSGWGKVKYEGLVFEKESEGNLIFYKYVKYVYDSSRELVQYNIYFRVNPRENKVPFEGTEIIYPAGKSVYMSIDTRGLEKCEDAQIAVHGLAYFLGNHGITVKSATPVEELANETKGGYVTCENKPDNPVILIQKGTETKITASGNCYQIDIANCEFIPALEKFMLRSLVDARNRNPVTKVTVQQPSQ